jgi:REP element-mobilizing transposase RayT
MLRTARASVGGVCYHVLNRGSAQREVFHQSEDYKAFIDLLERACALVPMRVPAWCPMPNHFHLVLRSYADDEWLRLVNQPQTQAELEVVRTCVQRCVPYGRKRWQEETALRMGLEFTLRPRGRPKNDPGKEHVPISFPAERKRDTGVFEGSVRRRILVPRSTTTATATLLILLGALVWPVRCHGRSGTETDSNA